jgi:acetyl-CoA acyltransferase
MREGAASAEAALVLVGGMESMTRIPMGGVKPSPNPAWLERRPELYMAMGATAERVAQRCHVARADQDAWALRSHQRAVAARARGVFDEEITPVASDVATVREDDAIRGDASLERLAKLEPAFEPGGSVTAGNACPTSDGASALWVASDEAVRAHGLQPLGRFVSYAVAGVEPALMGIGPGRGGAARPRAGRFRHHRPRSHRAERGVRLASDRRGARPRASGVAHERERRRARAGPSISGATGVRLVGTLLRELARSGGRRGLATLCVGGGMGAAMVVER